MRRALAILLVLAAASSCRSDLLAPVTTVDGQWTGIQNGYSLSLSMTQSGSTVTGFAGIAGVAGEAEGTITGSFVFPSLDIKISITGSDDISYKGTMSEAAAKINGKLNGSGFVDTEVDVQKR